MFRQDKKEKIAMTTAAQGWHVANWGLWGWLETVVKLIGVGVGIFAFFSTSAIATLTIGGSPRLAAVILLALLVVLTFGIIFLRLRQQEVISVLYAALNFLGHAGMLIALLRAPSQVATYGILFALAYIIGELIKQRFLVISGYTESGQNTQSMVMFSRGLAGIYLVLLIFFVI
jgi:hypothetical protein